MFPASLQGCPDLFEAAFLHIARDGAGMIEVAENLRKSLRDLATLDNPRVKDAARWVK